jgi:hypothetical protein
MFEYPKKIEEKITRSTIAGLQTYTELCSIIRALETVSGTVFLKIREHTPVCNNRFMYFEFVGALEVRKDGPEVGRDWR